MWEYFDDKSVITIKESKKIEYFKNHMAMVGIKDINVYYFDKSKTTKNSQNCGMLKVYFNNNKDCCNEMCKDLTQHHYTLIKDAYIKGKRNVLIFEDDATFELPFDEQKLNNITNWLENNEWDVFFFGQMNSTMLPSLIQNKDIMAVSEPTLTHAYAVNRGAMPKILEYIENHPQQHVDENIRKINIKKYASFPSMSYQDSNAGYDNMWLSKIIKFKTLNVIADYLSFYSMFTLILIIIIIMLIFRKK